MLPLRHFCRVSHSQSQKILCARAVLSGLFHPHRPAQKAILNPHIARPHGAALFTTTRAMSASSASQAPNGVNGDGPPRTRVQRRFAPLRPRESTDATEGATANDLPVLKGVIFDVDGTLCEPQNYMFAEMRKALGIPKSVDILDHIHSLPATDGQQDAAQEAIRDIERRAMVDQKPQPGLIELMDYLDKRGVRKGLCTRNFNAPVEHLLSTFLPNHKFEPVITRDFRPPKPSPAPLLHIAEQWGLGGAEQCIMVGDSVDDMTSGRKAGAATVLLESVHNQHLRESGEVDLVIKRLDDLVKVLEEGFVGRDHES